MASDRHLTARSLTGETSFETHVHCRSGEMPATVRGLTEFCGAFRSLRRVPAADQSIAG